MLGNAKCCVLIGPRHGTVRAWLSVSSRYSSHYIEFSLPMNLSSLCNCNDLAVLSTSTHRTTMERSMRYMKRWSLTLQATRSRKHWGR
jgi:hypothetical protein